MSKHIRRNKDNQKSSIWKSGWLNSEMLHKPWQRRSYIKEVGNSRASYFLLPTSYFTYNKPLISLETTSFSFYIIFGPFLINTETMKVSNPMPCEKISSYVDRILV